jgi:hypothetical protein
MPEYHQPQQAAARAYDTVADAEFAAGAHAGATSDKYIRVTVYLATVLFLVGISGHFPVVSARYALVAVGVLLVGFSVVELLTLPRASGGGAQAFRRPRCDMTT